MQRYYDIINGLSEVLTEDQMDLVFEAIALAVRSGAYSEELRHRLTACETNEALLAALTNYDPLQYGA